MPAFYLFAQRSLYLLGGLGRQNGLWQIEGLSAPRHQIAEQESALLHIIAQSLQSVFSVLVQGLVAQCRKQGVCPERFL